MKLYQVDAFTSQVFKGNPAGVCFPDKEIPDELMQNIAAEMNLSETAFLLQTEENKYQLRWFTPTSEVDLCGHATLASSFVLFSAGMADKNSVITYDTRSGELSAKLEETKIVMDFPQIPIENKAELPSDVEKALDISPLAVFGDKERFLIEISGLEELTAMKPDFNTLKEYPYLFMVTAPSDNPDYDFYSRFFAPSSGINEDPVTGSAHSSLAPHWSKKLNGKKLLIGYQASERSGIVECEIINNERLLIKGDAVIIFETDLYV